MTAADNAAKPHVVWAFTDNKPGHQNQTQGLLKALGVYMPIAVQWLPAPGPLAALRDLLLKRFPAGADFDAPDLLIGAGHGTHLPMLAARRARGGRAIVLMKPSLPLRCFDLCVIPEHDASRGHNVLTTRGALNPLIPAARKNPDAGMILIGGPSPHFGWDDAAIAGQVETIVARAPEVLWLATTSRRTPAATLARLRAVKMGNLQLAPVEETRPGWLAGKLATATRAWVSEDSVSMVYESLTAHVATGLLRVPVRRAGRVTRGLEQLVGTGAVTTFDAWSAGTPLAPPRERFNEAARVAHWIKSQWFPAG